MKNLLNSNSQYTSMPISNFELKSIDAERFTEKGKRMKNIRVDHNSSVTKMKQIDDSTCLIGFRFTANYKGMGRIEIEGQLIYKGEHSDLASKWQKNNKMPSDVANQVHSTIISNCIPEAVFIARELQLPPPIPLPKVKIPDKDGGGKKKIRKGGMEVA